MPRVEPKYNPIYSHGHMIWLDVCLQQYFTAGHLLEMGFYLERWQEIEEFEDEQKMLKKYINENLWERERSISFSINTPNGSPFLHQGNLCVLGLIDRCPVQGTHGCFRGRAG